MTSRSLIHRILATEGDLGATVARVTAGAVMFPHGAQKALGWYGGGGFSGTMEFMTGSAGLPSAVAVLVILGEFLGAIGLMVGALSRIAAAGFVIIMTGAIFMGHIEHGFFMNWFGQQSGEGFEYHLLMIGVSLVVVIRGGGRFSIDRSLNSARKAR